MKSGSKNKFNKKADTFISHTSKKNFSFVDRNE